jgi:purine-binding chemotaxis protein CheW
VSGDDRSRIELACFEVRGQLFGVDVRQLREVVRPPQLVRLPGAPGHIEGVVDLRGAIVPVLDLGRALAGDPVAETSRTRIAVSEVDGLRIGLRVDAACDVITVEASDVEAPPELVVRAGCPGVRAIVRRAGAPPVLVIGLEQLLASLPRRDNPEPPAG